MNRGIGLGVVFVGTFLVILGCQTTQPTPPVVVQEVIPPPFTVNGIAVALTDQRPDKEREPIGGSITQYRLGRASPNPWTQLAKETEVVVAAMPEKPQRVDVVVTSFRLVRREHHSSSDPSEKAQIGRNPTSSTQSMPKEGPPTGTPDAASPVGKDSDSLEDSPAGVSCRVRATIHLVFPGGREQAVEVKSIAVGQNTSGTKYYGEALDLAAKLAVRDYGNKFRQGVGLQPE